MIIGFSQRFVDKILSGEKLHTIRADVHDRWKTGKAIQFATGCRTKKYHQFKDGRCVSVQKIIIEHHVHEIGDTVIVVDERVLSLAEMHTLAINDGFDCFFDFCKWFDKDCFIGKLVHWTNYRY
jgi:hypothetical protein